MGTLPPAATESNQITKKSIPKPLRHKNHPKIMDQTQLQVTKSYQKIEQQTVVADQ